MFKRREKNATRIDTLIGKGTRIQGDIEFVGGLHIDGVITGNVRAADVAGASLSVSEHGTIEGSVEAPRIVVNGCVNGDIVATERAVLGAKARVQGNVAYGVIEIALGAEISGKLVPSSGGAPATVPVPGADAAAPVAVRPGLDPGQA